MTKSKEESLCVSSGLAITLLWMAVQKYGKEEMQGTCMSCNCLDSKEEVRCGQRK